MAEDRSVASGRTMDQIARGVGKAPRPFMLAKAGTAGAVWRSNRAESAAPRKVAAKKGARKTASGS
jgi:bifunctional non-homologous end joining protein LigD